MAAKTYDNEGNEVTVDEATEKARQVAFEQISKKAILVNMVRRQISNMPFDVTLSADVAKTLKMKNPDMIQIRKFLFDPSKLSKIRSLINDALLMVWNHTRPWDNIGYRLLPMEYYDDFNETFGKIKDEFEEAVQEFITNYDDTVAESKINLGKAFNKKDYPDKAMLNDMFTLEIETAQFPDIDDIRLNMSGPQLMSMQNEITERYNDAMNNAMDELINIVESNPNDPKANILLKTVDSLNVSDDPAIEMKLVEIRDTLGVKDVKVDKAPEEMMVIDDMSDEDLKAMDDDDLMDFSL